MSAHRAINGRFNPSSHSARHMLQAVVVCLFSSLTCAHAPRLESVTVSLAQVLEKNTAVMPLPNVTSHVECGLQGDLDVQPRPYHSKGDSKIGNHVSCAQLFSFITTVFSVSARTDFGSSKKNNQVSSDTIIVSEKRSQPFKMFFSDVS